MRIKRVLKNIFTRLRCRQDHKIEFSVIEQRIIKQWTSIKQSAPAKASAI